MGEILVEEVTEEARKASHEANRSAKEAMSLTI
jgi:hypothetical protein